MSKRGSEILEQFEDMDAEYQQRREVMTFTEYLDLVMEDPMVARNAAQRVYDMIVSFGSQPSGKVGQEKIPRYNFFNDRFDLKKEHEYAGLQREHYGPDAIFGIEDSLEKIVAFLRSSAEGKDMSKRFLLLLGPVASAKSTIANLLKKGYEIYTASQEGRMYTHEWVDVPKTKEEIDFDLYKKSIGEDVELSDVIESIPCPLNEDPLVLLPREFRRKFLEEVNKKTDALHKIKLADGTCTHCAHVYDRLMQHYDGNWKKVLEHVRVKRLVASEKRRVAIGTFKPKDEKNQDSTELTGDTNYLNVQKYGDDTHPMAFSHSGEFDKANRGMLEWVEIIKLQQEFLYELLDGTQDKVIKPKNQPNIPIDQVLFGHTNVPEYKRLILNESMEAIRNRIVPVKVPYNLELSEEVKIYEKSYSDGKTSKHIAPWTLHMAAFFAVLTRLQEPKKHQLTLVQKLKLYDGKVVERMTRENVKELMDEAPDEGLFGVSPRFIQNTLANLLSRSEYDGPCVNPLMLFRELSELVKDETTDASIPTKKERERYKGELLPLVEQEYKEIAKEELMKAITSDERAMRELFEKYVNNVTAEMMRKKVVDPITEEEYEPDQRFMRKIEERMGIPKEAAKEARAALVAHMNYLRGKGEDFDFKKDEKLYRGIQEEVFEMKKSQIDMSAIAIPERIQSEDDKTKLNKILSALKDDMGYCDHCADMLIKFAGRIIND
jgi:serine protein kinase